MSEEKKQETSAPVEVKEQPKEEIKAEQKLCQNVRSMKKK